MQNSKISFCKSGSFDCHAGGYPQYTEAQIKEMYENLKLPRRATKGKRRL